MTSAALGIRSDVAAVDMFWSTVMQALRARADGDVLLPTVLAQACASLTSAAPHVGGGVHGAAGANAARALGVARRTGRQ